MANKKPLLICMTPVRNEAWILNLFLKSTSLWADYIIIADQMSTDGSREIALKYPKVILIDNNSNEFQEADRQKILIDRAREIKGDKILFALDADEVLSANFLQTNDWKRILESNPGDVFLLQWAQICSNFKEYWIPETFFPWVIHDRDDIKHESYVRNIHSMRIPYSDDLQRFYIKDFKVLHFLQVYPQRTKAKQRFYMFVDYELNNRSVISLSRTYLEKVAKVELFQLNNELLFDYSLLGIDVFKQLEFNNDNIWFDTYVYEKIILNGKSRYAKVDIWSNDFKIKYSLKDPRSILYRVIHYYLRCTQDYSDHFTVRIIDKLLKRLGI